MIIKYKMLYQKFSIKKKLRGLIKFYFCRETRGVTRPNLVMPDTGHVAFDKVKIDMPLKKVTKFEGIEWCPSNIELVLLIFAHQFILPVFGKGWNPLAIILITTKTLRS